MKSPSAILLQTIFMTAVSAVWTSPASNVQDMCGGWKVYKDEKCVKIADKAGFQTQEDAENVCRTLSEDSRDSSSKLITIKSKEEQEFLQRYLFVDNEIADNVWIGLRKKNENSSFQWIDGSELSYSNWDFQTSASDPRNCVQMDSGDGSIEAGRWVSVSCKRKQIVVCERRPTWTMTMLQNTLLDFKMKSEKDLMDFKRKSEKDQEIKQKEAEEKQKEWERKFSKQQLQITTLRQRDQTLQQEISTLMENAVPVNFIYVQLPSQDPPTLLWPNTNWTEVSSSYAGLFFRVAGGEAAPFGQIQEGNTTRLDGVIYYANKHEVTEITAPLDGSWSKSILSDWHTTQTSTRGLRFRWHISEVRPRNQATKVWKRWK